MKRNKTNQLKLALFLGPTIVILVSFAVISLGFNIAIHGYIEKLTSKEIGYEFEFLDLYYSKADDDDGSEQEIESAILDDRGFFISVYYAILDDKYNEILPIESPMYSEKEANMAKIISDYFKSHKDTITNDKPIFINDGASSYYLKYKVYNNDEKILTIVAYADVTFILQFTDKLHDTLILIMIFSAIAAILFIWVINRKIDNSFNKLKSYILSIGKRQERNDIGQLDYSEFNEVLNAVNEMSSMIDRANDSQKQFFQNASHELRTPLMSIQGYAEGIASGVHKDNRSSAEIIVKQSQKMSKLVDELLFLSRMDTNAQLNIDSFDIKELIYDCTWRIKGICDKKGIAIVHELYNKEMFITADEEKIDRAVINILTNAARYAKSTIRVCCKMDNDSCDIMISNDGDAISKEDLPHIFDRFYKGKGGNFGIGLAIVKEILKQHGGTLSVESDVDNTTFIMSLPIKN